MNILKTSLLVTILFLSSCTASEEQRKSDSDIYMQIANEYLTAGSYDKAVNEADNAIKSYPKNWGAYFLKAEILGTAGRYDEAFAAIEATGSDYPKDLEFVREHWRGVVSYHQGNLPDSVSHFEKSLILKPDYVDSLIVLIQVYVDMNRLDDAIRLCERWVELVPDSGTAWESLGIHSVNNRQYAKAKEALDKALAINPKSPFAYNYLGRWADEQNRWEEAEKYYLKALELDDRYAFVNLSLGQLYMLTGRLDEAQKYLEKSLVLDPGIPFTHYWIGKYYQKKKDFPKSIHSYRRAIELNPEFSIARADIAELCLENRKDLDYAISLLLDGLIISPKEQKGFYYYLAKLSLAKKDFEGALGYLDKAFALIKESEKEGLADLHLLKGKVLLGKGDKTGAGEEFKIVLSLAPKSASANEARKLIKN